MKVGPRRDQARSLGEAKGGEAPWEGLCLVQNRTLWLMAGFKYAFCLIISLLAKALRRLPNWVKHALESPDFSKWDHGRVKFSAEGAHQSEGPSASEGVVAKDIYL